MRLEVSIHAAVKRSATVSCCYTSSADVQPTGAASSSETLPGVSLAVAAASCSTGSAPACRTDLRLIESHCQRHLIQPTAAYCGIVYTAVVWFGDRFHFRPRTSIKAGSGTIPLHPPFATSTSALMPSCHFDPHAEYGRRLFCGVSSDPLYSSIPRRYRLWSCRSFARSC